jgi:hypothetical protein
VCFLHFKALSGQIQQINKGIWSAEIISNQKKKKKSTSGQSHQINKGIVIEGFISKTPKKNEYIRAESTNNI